MDNFFDIGVLTFKGLILKIKIRGGDVQNQDLRSNGNFTAYHNSLINNKEKSPRRRAY